jgi:hypothetical protein
MTDAFLGSLPKSTINSKLASEHHCVFIISNIPMTCYMSVGHMTIHIPTAMNAERAVADNQQWRGPAALDMNVLLAVTNCNEPDCYEIRRSYQK